MKRPIRDRHLPGLLRSIAVEIPNTWTAEEACAVFELLDDLRDKVWVFYGLMIQAHLRELRGETPLTEHVSGREAEI